MSGETFFGHSMLENLHKIGITSIEKAPVTQPNIYILDWLIPNSLRQFLNLTIPNDCNLIPSGHGTQHKGAEINLKT